MIQRAFFLIALVSGLFGLALGVDASRRGLMMQAPVASGGGGPTLIIHDDFTGSSGSMSGRTPDTINTPGNNWAIGGGSYSVDGSGNATSSAGVAPYYNVVTIATGQSNVIAVVNAIFGGSASSIGEGVIFRYTDINNFWYARAQRSGNLVEIIERNASTETQRASAALTIGSSANVNVWVTTSGNSITVNATNNTTGIGTSLSYSSSFNGTAQTFGMFTRGGSFVTSQTEFKVYTP